MDDRAGALEDVVRLARQHGLTIDEIADALGATPDTGGLAARTTPASTPAVGAVPGAARGRGVLVRVLGFLGGTFVFAGVGVFIALQWDAMNSAARVVVTLGLGVSAFALASLARRDPRVERATTPLYLVAAALEPVGMLVAFDEFGSGGDWRWASLATAGAMAVQFGLAFVVARRSTLLFLCFSFATLALWTCLDLADLDGTLVALTVGATLILAAIWADRSGYRDVTPLWYFLGSASFLAAVFDFVESTPLELTFVGVAAAFVYLSVVVRSRTVLVVSTLAILSYTGWFTAEHFAESIGWPLALVGFGLVMIGLSALAVRLDRDYVRGGRQ